MKKWNVVVVLGAAQFVMVLDGTVMNVSISTVVNDLDTTVAAMQAAITFYTLTMAAFMLLGAKLGDVWGRRRAFVIGSCVYAIGSLITALSPSVGFLFLGWSVIEGLGAVLVIPAIAALVADNYHGHDRVTAFAIIGAVSGAAVAAGPLIGGAVTTYFNWRYVFVAEVVIMVVVVFCARIVADATPRQKTRIDVGSVLLSSAGLVLIVFGMLQSKAWGWIIPLHTPAVAGIPLAPLGVSLSAWCIAFGAVLISLFIGWQRRLVRDGRSPLLRTVLFSIAPLRSGLSVLGAQYAVTAGLFFMVPVYLQMTLGLDALETGIKIFPLSVSLILFSIVGTRLSRRWSPRRIVRVGQLILVLSAVLLLAAATSDLRGALFATGMFLAGSALGLLASQLGNVNMSSVTEKDTSDEQGLVSLCNDAAARLLGLSGPSEATGRPASDLLDGVAALIAETVVDDDAAPQRLVLSGERVLVARAAPVRVQGRRVGTVVTLMDRTELDHALRELAGAQSLAEGLRAQQHEFSNTLHTIGGLIELGEFDAARHVVDRAGDGGALSGLDAPDGVQDIELAAILLAKRARARELGVNLTISDDSRLPAGPGDGDLGTVVGNLLDNALDAAGRGGHVIISIDQADDGAICIGVEDDGPGVPMERRGDVFRLGYSTKTDDRQRGYGLTLVARVVDRRDGSVELSPADSGGARFIVRLPAVTLAEAGA